MIGNKYGLVVVVGNVASGKSTLAKKLAKKLKGEFVPADELYKVNPFFPLALEERKRWSLASDLWFLKERANLMRSVEAKPEQSCLVVDSGLPMSWVYANSRLKSGFYTELEWELYKSLFGDVTSGIVEADLIVYLKLDVDNLLERIKKRGREFEIANHDREYLTSLELSLDELVDQADDGKKLIVDGYVNFEKVLDQVEKKVVM